MRRFLLVLGALAPAKLTAVTNDFRRQLTFTYTGDLLTRLEIRDYLGLTLVTTPTFDGLDRVTETTFPEQNKLVSRKSKSPL